MCADVRRGRREGVQRFAIFSAWQQRAFWWSRLEVCTIGMHAKGKFPPCLDLTADKHALGQYQMHSHSIIEQTQYVW